MKSALKLFTLASGIFFAACGSPSTRGEVKSGQNAEGQKVTYLSKGTGSNSVEKIIGTNDLVVVTKNGVSLPETLKPLVNAFGKIEMGCTATHIGNGLVLTAGHCFDAGESVQKDKTCDYTVDWGYRADSKPFLTSKCVKILAMVWNDNQDWAIFQVDKAPNAKVEIERSSTKPQVGSTITIFGHPQGRPLEWSQFCTVQPASNGNFGEFIFSHQCDTEPGNSGSTVLNAQGKVVGIHDGGVVPWNYATFLQDTEIPELAP
jgi:hypothetical protein